MVESAVMMLLEQSRRGAESAVIILLELFGIGTGSGVTGKTLSVGVVWLSDSNVLGGKLPWVGVVASTNVSLTTADS